MQLSLKCYELKKKVQVLELLIGINKASLFLFEVRQPDKSTLYNALCWLERSNCQTAVGTGGIICPSPHGRSPLDLWELEEIGFTLKHAVWKSRCWLINKALSGSWTIYFSDSVFSLPYNQDCAQKECFGYLSQGWSSWKQECSQSQVLISGILSWCIYIWAWNWLVLEWAAQLSLFRLPTKQTWEPPHTVVGFLPLLMFPRKLGQFLQWACSPLWGHAVWYHS